MDDTLWAVAKELRNERSAAIEQPPAEMTETPKRFQPRRLLVAALVAAVLVVFHVALG
jgi:hypothetical protein